MDVLINTEQDKCVAWEQQMNINTCEEAAAHTSKRLTTNKTHVKHGNA